MKSAMISDEGQQLIILRSCNFYLQSRLMWRPSPPPGGCRLQKVEPLLKTSWRQLSSPRDCLKKNVFSDHSQSIYLSFHTKLVRQVHHLVEVDKARRELVARISRSQSPRRDNGLPAPRKTPQCHSTLPDFTICFIFRKNNWVSGLVKGCCAKKVMS